MIEIRLSSKGDVLLGLFGRETKVEGQARWVSFEGEKNIMGTYQAKYNNPIGGENKSTEIRNRFIDVAERNGLTNYKVSIIGPRGKNE